MCSNLFRLNFIINLLTWFVTTNLEMFSPESGTWFDPNQRYLQPPGQFMTRRADWPYALGWQIILTLCVSGIQGIAPALQAFQSEPKPFGFLMRCFALQRVCHSIPAGGLRQHLHRYSSLWQDFPIGPKHSHRYIASLFLWLG